METRGGEIRGAECGDGHQAPWAPGSSVSINSDFFSLIGGIIDWIHIGAEWRWIFLNLTHFWGGWGVGWGDFKACLLLCSTSHDQSQSEPCQTTITCFPGYSVGIKVQVQDGLTILFHYWPITQDSFEPALPFHKSAFSQVELLRFKLAGT